MVSVVLLVMQVQTDQTWNTFALALPLGKRLNSTWSCLCPRNVPLGWLDLRAIVLILNHSNNQIVKANST